MPPVSEPITPPKSPIPIVLPTFVGHVVSRHDALLVFEGCLSGILNNISRRPHVTERPRLTMSGNVFIWEEHSSGISYWEDGIMWMPLDLGDVPRGDAKRSQMIKQTTSVIVQGIRHHLVAYYSNDDMSCHLIRPCQDHRIQHLTPRPALAANSASVLFWTADPLTSRDATGSD